MQTDFATLMSGSLFYFLLANFALICVFFAINKGDLLENFKKIRKWTWLIFVIIFVFGFLLRLFSAGCSDPAGMCFDYVASASEMLKSQTVSDFWHPMAYSMLLATGFFFFGPNFGVVFSFNILVSCLTVIVVFLLAYVLFKREDAALFSAFIYSLFPLAIRFAKLNASEATSTFFIALTFLVFVISLKANKRNLYVLTALLAVFSLQVRTDAAFFVPMLAAGMYFNREKISFKTMRIPIVILILFSLPVVYYFVSSGDIYGPSRDPHFNERPQTFSITYLVPNISYILDNLANDKFYPILLYPFLVLSLFFIVRERNVAYPAILMAGYFALFGTWWMTIYNSTVIYELAIQPPMAVLMGYGLSRAAEVVETFMRGKRGKHPEKIKYAIKFSVTTAILCLIALAFFFSGGIVPSVIDDNCMVERIIRTGNKIGDGDCLLFDNSRSYYAKPTPLQNLEILLPGKHLATSMDECNASTIYFMQINYTRCSYSFFSNSTRIFEELDSRHALSLVEEDGCVSMYKVS